MSQIDTSKTHQELIEEDLIYKSINNIISSLGCDDLTASSLAIALLDRAEFLGISEIKEFPYGGISTSSIPEESEAIYLFQDGGSWFAVKNDFVNLQESEYGSGGTKEEALCNLMEGLKTDGQEALL